MGWGMTHVAQIDTTAFSCFKLDFGGTISLRLQMLSMAEATLGCLDLQTDVLNFVAAAVVRGVKAVRLRSMSGERSFILGGYYFQL